jgi:ABC-type uncharacterized transport system involved in gliding motility auxiliary subunit
MAQEKSYRKALLGGGAIVGAIVFLAIIGLIQYITLQHPIRWDLTRAGKYTLAPQSEKVLGTYKEKGLDIDVIAFYETNEIGAKTLAQDLFDQYRDIYSAFNYRFVDPDRNRALAVRHGIETYPTIVIQAGGKSEPVPRADEETVTNALVKLLRSERKIIYSLMGHGELDLKESRDQGFSQAKGYMEKQNYEIRQLALSQKPSVPEDASVLIIPGPQVDPTEPELESVKDFINKGGSLLVMLRPFKTSKLADFLSKYGLKFEEDIVVDRMSRVLGADYLAPVITTYENFAITENFDIMSVMPMCRSVRKADEPVPHTEPTELAFTSPVSWTISQEQLKSGDATFDENKGFKGPAPVMAVSVYTNIASLNKKSEKSLEQQDSKDAGESEDTSAPSLAEEFDDDKLKPVKSRIVVFGSAEFLSNRYIRVQGNSDLLLNTVSWLAEDEDLISIRPKPTRSRPIVLTEGQSRMVFWIPLIIVPAIFIVAGVAVFIRRRRSV